jgi:hypothetical protein
MGKVKAAKTVNFKEIQKEKEFEKKVLLKVKVSKVFRED